MQPLISAARRTSGLSQSEVARRAGTSRPTLSSYEHGHRSPTLETLIRLLAANGQQLEAIPMLNFTEHHDSRGKPFFVPDHLPRLSLRDAFATVVLPTHVDWSSSSAPRALADPQQRLLAYQVVLAEGGPDEISAFVDGALLIDAWPEIFLPKDIRRAWQPIIDRALG